MEAHNTPFMLRLWSPFLFVLSTRGTGREAHESPSPSASLFFSCSWGGFAPHRSALPTLRYLGFTVTTLTLRELAKSQSIEAH